MLQKLSPMLQIGFFTYIFLLKTLKSIIKPYFVKNLQKLSGITKVSINLPLIENTSYETHNHYIFILLSLPAIAEKYCVFTPIKGTEGLGETGTQHYPIAGRSHDDNH